MLRSCQTCRLASETNREVAAGRLPAAPVGRRDRATTTVIRMSAAETVNAFIRAIEEKDVDAAVAYLAADVSYENMPMDPIVGADGVAQTLNGFLAAASEVDWQIVEQWEVGDTVLNERVDRFKIGDGWLELPVAGIFKVTDGKITLWRDYFDMASYMTQLTALTS